MFILGWDEEWHGLGQGEFLVDGLRQVEAVLNALDTHGTGVSQRKNSAPPFSRGWANGGPSVTLKKYIKGLVKSGGSQNVWSDSNAQKNVNSDVNEQFTERLEAI